MDQGAVETELTRAELRRRQIEAAATACFSRDGFHAASMSSIAAEAALSVGQIYRYYEGKEAIIEAIVERGLVEWADRLAQVRAEAGGDLVEEMMEAARFDLKKIGSGERAALALEFFAEAGRNPRIRALVQRLDGAVRAHLRDVLVRSGEANDDTLEARLDMVTVLIDGWAVRTMKNPELTQGQYLAMLRPLFEILLRKAENPCG